jgi:methionyl-tRNA formyltransferase
MFNKILFLKRDNDFFSKKIVSELKKKSRYLMVISTDRSKVKINHSAKFDFILSFRSHHILKKKLIKKAKYGAINFHPGPPEYRGIGCVNYALYENSKNYGVTAHLIDEKIDHGKIINTKIFKIRKHDSVESLLQRTYNFQVKQAIQIIRSLSDDPKNLQKMVENNKEKKWSKKIKKRNFLNKFYVINKNTSRIELKKKIRATVTKKFKPYVMIHGVKFTYID